MNNPLHYIDNAPHCRDHNMITGIKDVLASVAIGMVTTWIVLIIVAVCF